LRPRIEGTYLKSNLTKAGLFINGMEALFSAFSCVRTSPVGLIEGEKAEADPKRRERAVTIFMTTLFLVKTVHLD
jgi:hypothetical protein